MTGRFNSAHDRPLLAGMLRRFVRTMTALIARIKGARAEQRLHRAAIESDLFHGRYRLLSKSDDDLPIIR